MHASGAVGLAVWFYPVYYGVFALIIAVAIALLWGSLRRPLERFAGTWPAKRLRWAAIPAVTLGFLALQTLLGAVARSTRTSLGPLSVLHGPWSETVGFLTLLLSLLTLVEGVVYLLRVRYPSERRIPAEGDVDRVEEEPGEEDAGEL